MKARTSKHLILSLPQVLFLPPPCLPYSFSVWFDSHLFCIFALIGVGVLSYLSSPSLRFIPIGRFFLPERHHFVLLSQWRVDDVAGRELTLQFPLGTILLGLPCTSQYWVIDTPSSLTGLSVELQQHSIRLLLQHCNTATL